MNGRMEVKRHSYRPLLWLALTASSTVVLLAGCGLLGPSRTVENYFPLAVGNQWCWVQSSNPSDSLVIEINGSHPLDGLTFYKFPIPGDTIIVYWFVHPDGELRMYFSQSDSAPDDTAGRDYLLWLKEPFDVGAVWQQPNDSAETLRIIDNDVTLSVPAGTFEHCLQVEDNVMGTYYYAPGVGWIKLGSFSDSAISYVLVRYATK